MTTRSVASTAVEDRRLTEISAGDARRLALRAQGLVGPVDRLGEPADCVDRMLDRLGAVQLDTISVLARSHELVAYARLGPVSRASIEAAYWGRGRTVEYWSHAASILPLTEWPYYAARRRRYRARWADASASDRSNANEVLARLRDQGPLTTEGLGGARAGGPWWDWSPLKVAVERLLACGDVVCTERRAWRRVYDLPERAIPAALRGDAASDEECAIHLVRSAGRRLGVATEADLADYHRLPREDVRRAVGETGLVAVSVDGWADRAWACPSALADHALPGPRQRGRPRLLSPFDSLIWDRPRTARLFGFAHRIEAYTPAERRVHGYYPMPLLHGGRLVGRVDPARRGRTLVVRQASLQGRGPAGALAAALVEAAGWVGCTSVVVERLAPAEARSEVEDALRRAGVAG